MSLFDGRTGAKPQTEARRYIYGCIAAALDNRMELTEGWFSLGPDGDEFDRRRLKKAVLTVTAEMRRKANGGAR